MAEHIALVTGAHGFLGRHTARQLAARGFAVHGIGHGAWDRGEWQRFGLSSFRAGDVTLENLLACPAPELLVHCAGGASVALSLEKPLLDFQRTAGTTAAALEFLRLRAPLAALVLPSSGSVYGSSSQAAVPESGPVCPQSPYAVHKLAAEQLCRSHGHTFGLRTIAVRLFSVYGPGLRKQLLWDACNKLSRGEALFGGTGEEIRDWIHVDDAASLLIEAAARASTRCPVVNGGTGVGTSVREVVSELAAALGARALPSFDGQERPGNPFRFVADNALARSWGWSPRVPWRDGLREYAAWFAGAP